MKKVSIGVAAILAGLLAVATAQAGGNDPRDLPPAAPKARETVTATPAQTAEAVGKARQAVTPAAPVVKTVPVAQPAPVAVAVPASPAIPVTVASPKAAAAPPAGKSGWQLGVRGGACEPLANVTRKVKNVGDFRTPQEFARQMQQRGYQAFVLDLGQTGDQEVRVKVPDLKLELDFIRAGLCR